MIEDHLDEYRALRSSLEERILAIATSVDGRRFTLQAPNIAQYIMLLHIAETWCRLAESVRDEDVSPQTLH